MFTTLGAGATAAVITAFGTQSRERREARAVARTAHIHAENIAKQRDVPRGDVVKAVAEVENAAFAAAVPWYVVAIYRDARLAHDETVRRGFRGNEHPALLNAKEADLIGHAERQATILLVRVLWHPWLSIPGRKLRAWQLRRLLNCGLPERDVVDLQLERMGRRRERKIIRHQKSRKLIRKELRSLIQRKEDSIRD